jgi:hypothetical protein
LEIHRIRDREGGRTAARVGGSGQISPAVERSRSRLEGKVRQAGAIDVGDVGIVERRISRWFCNVTGRSGPLSARAASSVVAAGLRSGTPVVQHVTAGEGGPLVAAVRLDVEASLRIVPAQVEKVIDQHIAECGVVGAAGIIQRDRSVVERARTQAASLAPGKAPALLVESVVVNAVVTLVRSATPAILKQHAIAHRRITEIVAENALRDSEGNVIEPVVVWIRAGIAEPVTLDQDVHKRPAVLFL